MFLAIYIFSIFSLKVAQADLAPKAACTPATWSNVTILTLSSGDGEYTLPIDYTDGVTTFGSLFDSSDKEKHWRKEELNDCQKMKQRFNAATVKQMPFEPVVVCGCANTGMVFVNYGMRCFQLNEDGKVELVLKWLAFSSPTDCRKEAKRQMGLGALFIDDKVLGNQMSTRSLADPRVSDGQRSKPNSQINFGRGSSKSYTEDAIGESVR